MASTNASPIGQIVSSIRQVGEQVWDVLEPVLGPIYRVLYFITRSFFRFMIFFGIVLFVLGVFFIEGTVAGHLGIYGFTSIVIGVIGRIIVRLKVRPA